MQEPFQNIPSQNTEFRGPKSTIFSRFLGKLEKYDKQFDIVSSLKITIDGKKEVKTGYENILKQIIANETTNNQKDNLNSNSNFNEEKQSSDGLFN